MTSPSMESKVPNASGSMNEHIDATMTSRSPSRSEPRSTVLEAIASVGRDAEPPADGTKTTTPGEPSELVEIIKVLSERYGFDYVEALSSIKDVSKLLKEEKGKSKRQSGLGKPRFLLPFSNTVMEGCCVGIRTNSGLYTQCMNKPQKNQNFCKTCDGKNPSIEERINNPNWRDAKGKAPKNYGNIMSSIQVNGVPVTKEEVIEEAKKFKVTIPDSQFDVVEVKKGRPSKKTGPVGKESPSKKRGRPRKTKPTLDGGDDMIAALVVQATQSLKPVSEPVEEPVSEPVEEPVSEPVSEPVHVEVEAPGTDDENSVISTSDEEKEKKPKKKRATKAEMEARKAKKEAEKAEKAAAKELEKAEKAKAKEAEKAEKAAARKAAKEAKAAEAAKAKEEADAARLAAEMQEEYLEGPVEETKGQEEADESDEEEVAVERWTYKGMEYLKDSDGTVYDAETHEELGELEEDGEVGWYCQKIDEEAPKDE